MSQPQESKWRLHGVRVVHASELDPNTAQTPGMNRAAAITHARAGAEKLWAGTVVIHPKAKTGAHHHGAGRERDLRRERPRADAVGRPARVHRRGRPRRFHLRRPLRAAPGDQRQRRRAAVVRAGAQRPGAGGRQSRSARRWSRTPRTSTGSTTSIRRRARQRDETTPTPAAPRSGAAGALRAAGRVLTCLPIRRRCCSRPSPSPPKSTGTSGARTPRRRRTSTTRSRSRACSSARAWTTSPCSAPRCCTTPSRTRRPRPTSCASRSARSSRRWCSRSPTTRTSPRPSASGCRSGTPHTLSERAQLVKLADKICNVYDIVAAPPADWGLARKREYLRWAKDVVDGLRGTHAATRGDVRRRPRQGRARAGDRVARVEPEAKPGGAWPWTHPPGFRLRLNPGYAVAPLRGCAIARSAAA